VRGRIASNADLFAKSAEAGAPVATRPGPGAAPVA